MSINVNEEVALMFSDTFDEWMTFNPYQTQGAQVCLNSKHDIYD